MDEGELQSKGVSTHAGFPNAASGSHNKQLDLSRLLIHNPSSTFLMQLDSDEWSSEGMHAGDIIIIDRSLDPKNTDLVVWWDQSQFIISKKSQVEQGAETWGTVISVIHQVKK